MNRQSGTTRDYLEQQIDLEGSSFRLVDTAGIEFDSSDRSIESAAQRMTSTRYDRADLKLFCVDSARDLNEWEMDQLRQCDGSISG